MNIVLGAEHTMSELYDSIIIGSGPAGVTAAIYCARKGMKIIIISFEPGGQVSKSYEIENYTGYQYITGPELTAKMEEHMEKFNFTHELDLVKKIERDGENFKVITDGGEFRGKTIIYAAGAKSREMTVPGEKEYKNRGVTYCATCDGPLFRDFDVAIIGGGNSGLEAVMQMTTIANKVYLIEIMDHLNGDDILVEKAKKRDNVEIMTGTKVKEIKGDMMVESIVVESNGKETEIPLKGVLVEIGYVPNSDMVDFVEKNKWKEIQINEACETNVPGFFAAGDVSSVRVKQIIVAAAEGCKAALSAFDYITRKK